MEAESFTATGLNPPVRGFLHRPAQVRPAQTNGDGVILSHGAGSNANAPLLVMLAEALSGAGFAVLRCDLPFRQAKSFGPPIGTAALDQAGLRNAVLEMRKLVSGRVFLGGHSYGGRQSTMLCAEEPELVSGLLLCSYPLHPPRKPEQLRTQHLPKLKTASLFVHGTRDPFGSIEESSQALKFIPAKTKLLQVEAAGHDLGSTKKSNNDVPRMIVKEVSKFFG